MTCQTMSMASRLRYFINSPTGPKTTHFWGPVANWGFVLAVRTFSLYATKAYSIGLLHVVKSC